MLSEKTDSATTRLVKLALDRIKAAAQVPHLMVARVIVLKWGGVIRYCRDERRWYVFDGMRWAHDGARIAVDELVAGFITNQLWPSCQALTPFAKASMANRGYIRNVVEQLENIMALSVRSDELDADAWLLGTPEGVVDLRNGTLSPMRPELMISMLTSCGPAGPGEARPQWDAFIEWFTDGDKALARFLRMWLGSSLIGNNRDQRIVFLWGNSANGKSVLLRAIGLTAGDYHATTEPELLMVQGKSGGGARPGLVKALGKRMVTGSEVPKGAEWSGSMIKMLCSDEPIAARQIYQEETDIKPRCSVTLAGNDLPTFTGLDEAIMRRFITVHCLAGMAEAERIADYGRELYMAEGPGIMAWLVEGALDRELHGFIEPAVVKAASAEYFESEDVLAQFVNEKYDRNADGEVNSTDMFMEWQSYNKGLGRPRDMTQMAFSMRLGKMGFEKRRDRKDGSMFKGLSPKPLL